MTEKFKPEIDPEAEELNLPLEKGAEIYGQSGSLRKVTKVDNEKKCLLVEYTKTPGEKAETKLIYFKDFNKGLGTISHIIHPDGRKVFFDPVAELKDLEEAKRKEDEVFERGGAMIQFPEQIAAREARIEKLKAQLGKLDQ